jgi:hypothetical protein
MLGVGFSGMSEQDAFYLHIGVACSSWGPAGRLNKGTRTPKHQEGLGALAHEAHGNEQADFVGLICAEFIEAWGFFTIENPVGSYVFLYDPIARLSSLRPCLLVSFPQCAYGLCFPGCSEREFRRKNAYVLSDLRESVSLAWKCPGAGGKRVHAHAWGSLKREGQILRRAGPAGKYPRDLCEAVADWR